MKKKIKDIFLYFLIAIPTVYILLLLFLYFYQRNLLYHPNENNYFGDNLKIEVDRIKIKTSDNLDLNAWYYEKDKNKFKTANNKMNINLPKFKPFDHNTLLLPAFVPKVAFPELVPK